MRVTVKANPGVRRSALRAALPVMRRLGDDIVRDMHVHPWHNITGQLEAGTHAGVDPINAKLTVENKVEYAWDIEFGTSDSKPFPWMLPALLRNRGKRT